MSKWNPAGEDCPVAGDKAEDLMTPIVAGLLALVAIAGGSIIGLLVAWRLPENHREESTRMAVSVSMAIVGTLSALVLGLVLNSAGTSFSLRTGAIETIAMDLLKLDRLLHAYGPSTAHIRTDLQAYTRAKAEELAQSGGHDVGLTTLDRLGALSGAVLGLAPADEREKALYARAVRLIEGIEDSRWLLFEKSRMVMPTSFLVMLVLWLALLFSSFGLFAPRNGTAVTFLLLGAAAISGSIFVTLELGSSRAGFILPSVEPLYTVANLMRQG